MKIIKELKKVFPGLKSISSAAVLISIFLFNSNIKGQIFTKLPLTTSDRSAGSGWIDYNNDNKLDAYLSYFNSSPKIYSNTGDGSFQTLSQADIIPSGKNYSGLSWGDYDNDGKADLYLTSMNGSNQLYQNLGNGQFQSITNSVVTKDGGSFLSSNWVDYNNDGFLDLFVTASGTGFTAGTGNNNLLYKNNSDGTFIKVINVLITSQKTFSACAAFADFDNDGDQDLFMTEWGKDNWLFENNGDESFTKISGTAVNSNNNISITASWGDYDNDGYLDLFVGNGSTSSSVKQQNYLFHNNGDKTFTKITSGDVAEYSGCVWASAWGDVDNDGDLDLYVGTIYEHENILYINNGNGTFTATHEFENDSSASQTGVTGVSFGDYDNDGFLDLLVADAVMAGNPVIYHNNGNSNKWINISSIGTLSNRNGIGARVKVKATIFGKAVWQIREISPNQGFRGSNDLRAHFGLGDAVIIDSVVVNWPSNETTILTDVQVNQFLSIKENAPTGYLRPNFKADKISGYSPLKIQFTDLSINDETHPITSWSWDFNCDGIEDSKEQNPAFNFYSYSGENCSISLTISNGDKNKTIIRENYIHILPLVQQNVALSKIASTSTDYSSLNTGASAVDGSASTSWISLPSDTQWIKIELDSLYLIGKIVLNWGYYFAKKFDIQYSEDGNNWFNIVSVDNGDGNVENLTFNAVRGKFILLSAWNSSKSGRGYSLKEFEIYRAPLTGIKNVNNTLPAEFKLFQNYPNPFNPNTIIKYQLRTTSYVTLKIYDILGKEVTVLVNQEQQRGEYKLNFEASKYNVSSGVYFCELKVKEINSSRELAFENIKMILLK